MAIDAADVPKIARDAAAIYQKWGRLINRYHAGYPPALLAVRIEIESGGKMGSPGDQSLGEVGLLQVTAGTEDEYGVAECTRCTAEGNAFLGALDYNVDAVRINQRYPGLVADQRELYTFATLPFVIGWGGANWVYSRVPRPISYDGVVKWTQGQLAAGKIPKLGSQSPGKVAYRVKAVGLMAQAAELASQKYGISNEPGVPAIPPLPSSIRRVSLPRDVAGRLKQMQGTEDWRPNVEELAIWGMPPKQGRGAVIAVAGLALGGVGLAIWRLTRG